MSVRSDRGWLQVRGICFWIALISKRGQKCADFYSLILLFDFGVCGKRRFRGFLEGFYFGFWASVGPGKRGLGFLIFF